MADITVTTHPAQLVAALRTKIDAYTDEHTVWAKFMEAFQKQGLTYTGEPCGAIFHDPEYRESDIDIELWQPVPAEATASTPLFIHELPAQRVVVATFHGDYSQFEEVNVELADHITSQNLTIAGPMYNRYLVGPAHTQDPTAYLTEVCVPVA